jgi:hypothetical protein
MIALMAFRVAGVSVPGPSDVLGAAQAAAGWSARAVESAVALPERLATVLDDVDHLVRRIGAVAERADELVDRAGGILHGAEQAVLASRAVVEQAGTIVARADATTKTASTVVARAEGVVGSTETITARAGRIVEGAATTTTAAGEILAVYQPIAERAAPLAKRFVDDLTDEEIHAAIRLIDHLPALTEAMETDIMPILATLDRVGPDVSELLEVLKDVRQAISGIPGFRFFRRRGEEQEAEEHARRDSAASG